MTANPWICASNKKAANGGCAGRLSRCRGVNVAVNTKIFNDFLQFGFYWPVIGGAFFIRLTMAGIGRFYRAKIFDGKYPAICFRCASMCLMKKAKSGIRKGSIIGDFIEIIWLIVGGFGGFYGMSHDLRMIFTFGRLDDRIVTLLVHSVRCIYKIYKIKNKYNKIIK